MPRRVTLSLWLFLFFVATASSTEEPGPVPDAFVESITTARRLVAEADPPLPVQFLAPTMGKQAAFLERLIGLQKTAAQSELQLSNALDDLETFKEVRDTVPRRWQALYDYTVASLLTRLVARKEYNALLADLRKDFRDQNPTPRGWELTPQDTPHDFSAQKIWKRANDQLEHVVADYPDLPWVAALAKRDHLALQKGVGLSWKTLPQDP